MKPVLFFGDINLDAIMPIAIYPQPGRDGLVESVTLRIGGAVVNSAVVLHRLGQPAALIGCTGEDVWARQVLVPLHTEGIDLRGVSRNPTVTTGLTFIVVTPDGQRTMFSYRGANVTLSPERVPAEMFSNAAVLQLSGYGIMETPQRTALWRAVTLAEAHGVPVSLDTGLEPVIQRSSEMRRLIPHLAVCILGMEEAEVLYNATNPAEALDSLLDQGVALAAVKLGDKGCAVADRNRRISLPAYPVFAVDSTGAGDAFSAGLLYAWLRGWPLARCAALANALGALAASVYGAGLGLPGRTELLAFLKTIPPESPLAQVTAELNQALLAETPGR